MQNCMQASLQWQLVMVPHFFHHFLIIFCASFIPAKLLGSNGAHDHREFRWRLHIFKVFEFPLFELCTITQVQIFRQGVPFPISSINNGRFSPNPSCTIEINKVPSSISAHLFECKMRIQCKGLHLC